MHTGSPVKGRKFASAPRSPTGSVAPSATALGPWRGVMSGFSAEVEDDAATQPDTDDEIAAPAAAAAAAAAAASHPGADSDGVIRVRLPPLKYEMPHASTLWSLAEDADLRASMRRLGPPPFYGDPFPHHKSFPYWSSIAADLPGRSARSCFCRFSKYPTAPTSLKGPCLWSAAEVAALQRAAAHHAAALERGPTCQDTWVLISAALVAQGFPERGANAAYAKWWSGEKKR